jgi:hypothetical protein
MGPNNQDQRSKKWQPDRTYNIPNIVSALLIAGSFSGWLIFETSRITALEVKQSDAKEEGIIAAAQAKEDLARIASALRDSNLETKDELRSSAVDVKEALRLNQQDVKEQLTRIEDHQRNIPKLSTK